MALMLSGSIILNKKKRPLGNTVQPPGVIPSLSGVHELEKEQGRQFCFH